MIYFLPGMLLALLATPRAGSIWKRPAMWLASFVAIAVVAPNVAWNIEHSFATVHNTENLVLDQPFQLSLGRALEFLASQLAVMGPIVFVIAIIASVRFKSPSLIEPDRLMAAFFITPIIAVTAFALYSQANANWAAPSVIPAVLICTALALRSGQRYWLWISIGLGLTFQCVLLPADATATQLPARIGGFKNPYNRTLGFRAAAERLGRLAASVGAQSIATDNRSVFYTLRYYGRRQSQAIVSWRKSGEFPYDLSHPLTSSTPGPILLITDCGQTDRLKPYFASVTPLDHRQDADWRFSSFFAFRLDQAKGESGPLRPCES